MLGTVAWTVVADTARADAWRAAAYQHALTADFDRAFLVSAAIAALSLVVALTVIRVRRADLGNS